MDVLRVGALKTQRLNFFPEIWKSPEKRSMKQECEALLLMTRGYTSHFSIAVTKHQGNL